jgi:hypothetical protein
MKLCIEGTEGNLTEVLTTVRRWSRSSATGRYGLRWSRYVGEQLGATPQEFALPRGALQVRHDRDSARATPENATTEQRPLMVAGGFLPCTQDLPILPSSCTRRTRWVPHKGEQEERTPRGFIVHTGKPFPGRSGGVHGGAEIGAQLRLGRSPCGGDELPDSWPHAPAKVSPRVRVRLRSWGRGNDWQGAPHGSGTTAIQRARGVGGPWGGERFGGLETRWSAQKGYNSFSFSYFIFLPKFKIFKINSNFWSEF